MGNEHSTLESSADSPLSRNNSKSDKGKVSRKISSSPPRRTGSLRRHHTESMTVTTSSTTMSSQPIRRSKTCRVKDRNDIRRAVCNVTGLTLHQKALLTRKWNRMDKNTVYELGRRVFEGIFEASPDALAHIGLRDEPEWRGHISFRMHVQQFVLALSECVRRMRDPTSASDILRDFGSSYAQESEKKRVPATFFEKLANALNDAARQLQESDHLTVERNRSHSADDPSESSSEGGGRDASTTTTSTTTVLSDQFRPSICSGMTSNNNSSPSFLLPTDHSCCFSVSSSSDRSSNGLCPITSEAWLIFAVYVANQIKFGYEMERMLQAEMSKLGLNNRPKTSIVEPPLHGIAIFN